MCCRRSTTLLLILVASFGLLFTVPNGAAESVNAEQIDELIGQLSSRRYSLREEAQQKLAALGMDALDALREAIKSDDMETSRRAKELVEKLESEIHTANILQPTLVHLVYKDTPLVKAIADFSKQSGYKITLAGSSKTLASKKITLDTGKVSFWQAYDQFCLAAGLTDASVKDLKETQPNASNDIEKLRREVQQLQQGIRRNRVRNVIRQVRPARQVKPQNPKAVPDKKQEAEKKAREKVQEAAKKALEEKKKEAEKKALEEKQKAIKAQQKAQQAQIQAIKQKLQQIQQQAQIVQLRGNIRLTTSYLTPTSPSQPTDLLVLKPGKHPTYPTIYVGAVRIRLLTDLIKTQPTEHMLPVELSVEPRLLWQQIDAVIVQKALDTLGQELAQRAWTTSSVRNAPVQVEQQMQQKLVIINNLGSYSPQRRVNQTNKYLINLHLKKNEKTSKVLKEITGTLCVKLLTSPEKLITVKDVLNTKKAVKGKKGGEIRVVKATVQGNNQFVLQVEVDRPLNVVPYDAVNVPLNINQPFNGRVLIQRQIGGFRTVTSNRYANGLVLTDSKGDAIKQSGNSYPSRISVNGKLVYRYTIMYQLKKDQKPKELNFLGRMPTRVDVPFHFENVALSR